jgi:hypothetical protein
MKTWTGLQRPSMKRRGETNKSQIGHALKRATAKLDSLANRLAMLTTG